ncbi:MAG: methyl-accepting chemotaxis protein [Gallionella sp.]|jgi:twitching motility protein PilJ
MAFNLNLPNSKKAAGSSEKLLPLIGHLPFAQQAKILTGALAATFLVGAVSVVLDNRASSHGAHHLDLAGDLVMLTQRTAKDAGSALQGKQTAIDGLPHARSEIESILTSLTQGDAVAPATSGAARAQLDKLTVVAQKSLLHIKEIEDGRAGILTVSRAIEAMSDVEEPMRAALARLPVTEQTTRFGLLFERVGKDANAMMGRVVTDEMVRALATDTAAAEALLAGFDKTNANVAEVVDLFEAFRNSVLSMVSQAKGLFAAKNGANAFFDDVSVTKKGAFVTAAGELKQAYTDSLGGRWTSYLMGFSALTLLMLAGGLFRVYLGEARRAAGAAEATNKQTQQAILRLMNELSDLGDGDLTVRATVTEDITGAIADSVNYTAEELHKLVSNVSNAAEQMGVATQESEGMAQRLLLATQKQEQEIREAEESVQLIVRSIGEVDAAAIKATEVGKQTLLVTNQGALAVRNTITGMDGIREHIQETSKRIKRLGESSQEIGEIVDLISDITEQTNVLALNAAIQAASAGEAGRGFSVVAEEVQRLAERSADATKQIGALVKMIQSDTHDAVAAMEKSTLGVVEGAKLSEMSGQSLKEIEQVSDELATLINSISVSTQVQTDMAGEVASVMHEIMKLTRQTAEGSRLTSDSAIKLTGLASGLRGSVAGFKL